MKKRIISFSLWGDNLGYCDGAIENIKRAPKFYPGWTCRVYCDQYVPKEKVQEMLENGSDVTLYQTEKDPWLGLYRRFYPMFDDPTVERFIVRDTDSRINAREADAVAEWIESGLPFHCMRDNPAHNIPIMGGMWGSVARLIPDFKILMDAFIETLEPDPANPRGAFHGSDQIFLGKYIWPMVEKCNLTHDEYFKYTGREKPFRVKLQNDGYVGMVFHSDLAERIEAIV